MKQLIFLLLLMSFCSFAQNDITNTIGTGGKFVVKDGTNTFITVQQSDGAVGVGKTPSYKLDVNGDVNVSGNFRVNGSAIPTVAPFIQTVTSGSSNLGAGTYYLSTYGVTTNQTRAMFILPKSGTRIKLIVAGTNLNGANITITLQKGTVDQSTGVLSVSDTPASLMLGSQFRLSETENITYSENEVFIVKATSTGAITTATGFITVTVSFE